MIYEEVELVLSTPDYVIGTHHIAFIQGLVDNIKFKENGIEIRVVIIHENSIVNIP